MSLPSTAAPAPVVSSPPPTASDLAAVTVGWLVLGLTVMLLASRTLSVPGVYYDEAIYGGMAKDFLTGQPHGSHLPGNEVISVFGHPFPLYAQAYLGSLKSWLVLPAFSLFGCGPGVLRWTSLGWALLGLLFFMLWVRRVLGVGAALVAGALLALDPAFLFSSSYDWGMFVPSLLCRSVSFYLVVRWWQGGRMLPAFLAGVFAGLGLFNKVDFAIILGATALAGAGCYLRPLHERARARPGELALAALGFVLAGSLMLVKLPQILEYALSGSGPGEAGELREKFNTLLAMYDGSYFYRLMNVGGLFQKMYDNPAAVWTPFGIVVALSAAVLAVSAARGWLAGGSKRAACFLVLAPVLITLGVFLLPEAVRIHHALSVYPFPQLAVAAAVSALWRNFVPARRGRVVAKVILVAVVSLLLLADLRAIGKTQRLILNTGGRGWWSESLDRFCRQVSKRTDLQIVSLDWGFNEQLLYLTDGPQLAEPFWAFGGTLPAEFSKATNCIYLVHPAEYSLFSYGPEFLSAARAGGTNVDIQAHCDREKHVAFYSIRFLAP